MSVSKRELYSGVDKQIAGTRLAYHLRQLQKEFAGHAGGPGAAIRTLATKALAGKTGRDPYKELGGLLKQSKHGLANAYNWNRVTEGLNVDSAVKDYIDAIAAKEKAKSGDDFYQRVANHFDLKNGRQVGNDKHGRFWDGLRNHIKSKFGGVVDSVHLSDDRLNRSIQRHSAREQDRVDVEGKEPGVSWKESFNWTPAKIGSSKDAPGVYESAERFRRYDTDPVKYAGLAERLRNLLSPQGQRIADKVGGFLKDERPTLGTAMKAVDESMAQDARDKQQDREDQRLWGGTDDSSKRGIFHKGEGGIRERVAARLALRHLGVPVVGEHGNKMLEYALAGVRNKIIKDMNSPQSQKLRQATMGFADEGSLPDIVPAANHLAGMIADFHKEDPTFRKMVSYAHDVAAKPELGEPPIPLTEAEPEAPGMFPLEVSKPGIDRKLKVRDKAPKGRQLKEKPVDVEGGIRPDRGGKKVRVADAPPFTFKLSRRKRAKPGVYESAEQFRRLRKLAKLIADKFPRNNLTSDSILVKYAQEQGERPMENDPKPADQTEPQTHTCPNCSAEHNDEDEIHDAETESGRGCWLCTSECEDCDNQVPDDSMTNVSRNRNPHHVCQTCLDNDYGNCEDCENWTVNDELTDVGGRRNPHHVCNSCLEDYSQCNDCDRWLSSDDTIGDGSGNDICPGCYENNYFTCDGCNETQHNGNYGEDGLCENCHDERKSSDHIHPYGYEPDLNFHGKGRHYGAELETILKTSSSRSLDEVAEETLGKLNEGYDEEGFAYLKEDSSLDEGKGGFEIVTHPATMPIQKQQWDKVLGANTPKGLVSHDTNCCGLHFHVEKKDIGELSVAKIVSFVNSENARDFVEAIARRKSDRWAKLQPKKISEANKRNSSRYEAVNLQNPHTIEFRIFKGTLNKESFNRSLEFVDSVVEYCKQASLQDTHNLDKYHEFVLANKEHYPELAKFVNVYRKDGANAAKKLWRSV